MFGSPAHRERLKLVVIDKTEYLYLPRTLAAHVDKERYRKDAIRKNEEKFTKSASQIFALAGVTYVH